MNNKPVREVPVKAILKRSTNTAKKKKKNEKPKVTEVFKHGITNKKIPEC